GDLSGARRRRPDDADDAAQEHAGGGAAADHGGGRWVREPDLFSAVGAFARAPAGAPAGRGGGVTLAPAGSGQAYSVSAVNGLVWEFLEGAFPPLLVAGEVSGWKRHTSVHYYFSLRDATAQLRCVMFRSDAHRLPTDPDEGMEVRVLGTL